MLMAERVLAHKLDDLIPILVKQGSLLSLWEAADAARRYPDVQEFIACLRNCPEYTAPRNAQEWPEGSLGDRAPLMPSAAAKAQEENYRGHDDSAARYAVASASQEILAASRWFTDKGFYSHARVCVLAATCRLDQSDAPADNMLWAIGDAAWRNSDYWTALQCFQDCGNIPTTLRFADDLIKKSRDDAHANAAIVMTALTSVGEPMRLIEYGDLLASDKEWNLAMEAYLCVNAIAKALNLIDRVVEEDPNSALGLMQELQIYFDNGSYRVE